MFYLCLLLLLLLLLYIDLFKSCSPHDHMLQKKNDAAKHVHQMLQKNEQSCKSMFTKCCKTGGNPAPVTAHSCSRETLSPPRPPNQCCFRGAFRWCRIMSIQLLFLQQRCNPSMLNGGREGCSHPGLRVVHDSFHPPSGETVFSASDGCFFF